MKTYKVKTKYILSNLLVMLLILIPLTILTFSDDVVVINKLVGLGIFYLFTFILTFLPLNSRLIVGKGYVQNKLLGFNTSSIAKSNVTNITYGNLFKGGLGFGKGLKISVIRSNRKTYHNIPEKIYGKEAIDHVKRVLDKNS